MYGLIKIKDVYQHATTTPISSRFLLYPISAEIYLVVESLISLVYDISSLNKIDYWDKLILFFSSRCFNNVNGYQAYPIYLASHIIENIKRMPALSSFDTFSQSLNSLQSLVPYNSAVDTDISCNDVMKALFSFSQEASIGPDGILPQHLKELTRKSTGKSRTLLQTAITLFVKIVLTGAMPPDIRPFFFGAALVAFHNKGGVLRPIATGAL